MIPGAFGIYRPDGWNISSFRMMHSDLSEKKHQHFGRKSITQHLNFPELPKSVYEGLKRFADSRINQLYT